MILFASFAGWGVGWSLIFWRILTIPAVIMGLLGVVAGSLRRTGCAVGLGVAACLVELLSVAFVWICFREEQVNLGAGAERFRPGHPFWEISLLTLFLGSLAFGLGARGGRTVAAKKNGVGEL
jgi:hypothetical protein